MLLYMKLDYHTTCAIVVTSSNQRLGVRSLPVIIVVCY